MSKKSYIGMNDPDGTTREVLEAYMLEWKKRNPGGIITMSDAIRITSAEALIAIRERKPKLQDKQKTGGLRK